MATNKLNKTIDRLAKEMGYPYRKLTTSEYYQVLLKAYEVVYSKKIPLTNQ